MWKEPSMSRQKSKNFRYPILLGKSQSIFKDNKLPYRIKGYEDFYCVQNIHMGEIAIKHWKL